MAENGAHQKVAFLPVEAFEGLGGRTHGNFVPDFGADWLSLATKPTPDAP